MQEKNSVVSDDKNELIQIVKLKLDKKTFIVRIYVGIHTNGGTREHILSKIYGDNKLRIIFTDDISTRHISWDKVKNPGGRAVVRIASQKNYNISLPTQYYYMEKAELGESKQDIHKENGSHPTLR